MEALDSIEKRIDALSRVLGASSMDEEHQNAENLQESLVSANTLLSSAMSGRKPIIEMMKRTGELENLLNPDFIDEKQDLKTKELYLNAVAPQLVDSCNQLEQIKALESTLGAEYFRAMPDVSDKLKAMNETTASLAQKNDLLEETLTLTMQRYDELQNSLKDTIKTMSERIERIENILKEKKKLNEDV